MRIRTYKDYIFFISLMIIISGCNPFDLDKQTNLPARFEWTFPVSGVPGVTGSPAMTWAGDRWGIVYVVHSDTVDMDMLYFISVHINSDEMSYTIENEKLISSAEIMQSPDIVWNGDEFGIVWSGYNNGIYDIWFCRVDINGSLVLEPYTPDAISNDNSHSPALAWNKTAGEYTIIWEEKDGNSVNTDIRYVILDSSGSVNFGPEYLVPDSGSTSRNPDIVWTGTDYEYVWEDNTSGHFDVYSHIIGSMEAPVNLTEAAASDCHAPRLTLMDSGVCCTWYEEGGTIQYTKTNDIDILSLGNINNNPVFPSIAANGTDTAFMWQETDNERTVVYYNLPGQQEPMQMPVAGTSTGPCLEWNGTYFAAVWCCEETAGNRKIYFTF